MFYETEVPAKRVLISKGDMEYLLSEVFETGAICYWSNTARPCDENGTLLYSSDEATKYMGGTPQSHLLQQGHILFFDNESDDTWPMNIPKFLNGVGLYAAAHPDHTKEGPEPDTTTINLDELDSGSIDEMVQYALFGEIQFG